MLLPLCLTLLTASTILTQECKNCVVIEYMLIADKLERHAHELSVTIADLEELVSHELY